jgi:hypothetical protein
MAAFRHPITLARLSSRHRACGDDELNNDSEERAERLLDQLHQWAMEALEVPRDQRDAFIVDVATKYQEDAVRNGLSESQADEWRQNIDEWLHALIETIEVSGGAAGGHG